MQPAPLVLRVEQLALDPAVEHRVRGLVDQQRHPEPAQDGGRLRVFAGEYDEMPTYRALPCCTAVASAPIVSSSGVSGSKRCE